MQWRDPNGNLDVLVLNRNGAKRELDYNWFDNRWNRNYRFAARRLRNSLHFSSALAWEFCLLSCPLHPPSILPVSSTFMERTEYFLVLRDLLSHITIKSNLSVSNLRIASRTYGILSACGKNAAAAVASIISKNSLSMFSPIVYRCAFGSVKWYSCHKHIGIR